MLLRLWVRGIVRIRLPAVKLLGAAVWRMLWSMVRRRLRRETVFWTLSVGRRQVMLLLLLVLR